MIRLILLYYLIVTKHTQIVYGKTNKMLNIMYIVTLSSCRVGSDNLLIFILLDILDVQHAIRFISIYYIKIKNLMTQ